MVHLDYELVPSNRVYESRDNKNLYEDRVIKVSGGYLTVGTFFAAFLGSYGLFYKSFSEISFFKSKNANKAIKLIAPAYLSLVFARFIRFGCVLNLGDPQESLYLNNKDARKLVILTDLSDNISMKNLKILENSQNEQNYLDNPNLLNKLI